MIKDLHSAILFCAFLSSSAGSTTSLQTQTCANARPFLSTLFGTRNSTISATRNVDHRSRSKVFLKPNSLENTQSRPSCPRFFDPSFIPLDFRIRNVMHFLKRAKNSARGSPPFLNPRSGRTYHVRDRKMVSRHCFLNRSRYGFPKAISTGRPLFSTNESSSKIPSSDKAREALQLKADSNSKGRERSLDLSLDEFDPKTYGQLSSIAYGKKPINEGLCLISQEYDHRLSSIYLKLCQALVLAAFHQSAHGAQNVKEASQTPLNSIRWEFPWLVEQANLVWRYINAPKRAIPSSHLSYTTTKVQLLALSGDMDAAESIMDELVMTRENVGNTPPWHVLQCLRTIFVVSLHRDGKQEAFLRLLRRGGIIQYTLDNRLNLINTHHARVYAGLLRKAVFGVLDEIKPLSVWYDQVGSSQPGATAALRWSQTTHARLGSLALSYLILRLRQAPEDDNLDTLDLIKDLSGLISSMRSRGYTIPEDVLLQCGRSLAKNGQLALAEELWNLYSADQAQYNQANYRTVTPAFRDRSRNQILSGNPASPIEEHNQVPNPPLLRSSASQHSVMLHIAALKGDVLKALDAFTELFRLNVAEKRDIRHLLQAYTRAPPSELASGEVEYRLNDAEEIFKTFFAPLKTSAKDYGALISAYAHHGNVEKVKAWIRRMTEDGISVELVPWGKLLKAFAANNNVLAVASLIDLLEQIQSQQSSASVSSGKIKLLRDDSVFNVLLDLFIRRRDPHNAERLWRNCAQGANPASNYRTVVRLMRAHGETGNWSSVIRMWDYLQSVQPTNDAVLADTQSQPLRLHDATLSHDIEVCNILLRAHVAIGAPYETVLRLYDRLASQSESRNQITPDSFTFTMLIIAATDSGEMDQANQFFRMMEASEQERLKAIRQSHSLNPKIPIPSTLLGSFTYRSIYALTYIMAGYIRQKMFQKATAVYEEIQRRGLALLPLTCAVLLRAYVKEESKAVSKGPLDLAEDFLSRIVDADQELERFRHSSSLPPTTTPTRQPNEIEPKEGISETQTNGMDGGPSGETPEPNLIWVAGLSRPRARESLSAPLLSEYVRRQDPVQIERILDEVVQVGGEPSISSLTMLMDAQRKIGDHLAVEKTWERIWDVTQVVLKEEKTLARLAKKARTAQDLTSTSSQAEASSIDGANSTSNMRKDIASTKHSRQSLLCYPFSVYMDAMSRAGHHASVAIEWQRLRDAGFAFDAHNWNHLVVALVRAGEVERAVEVVEKVILAYAEASQRIVVDRDRGQLKNSLADVDKDEDEEEEASTTTDIADGDYRWARRREMMKDMIQSPFRMARFEKLSQASPSEDLNQPFDFVHDLHVLQQLNRYWNIWKPHRQVLKELYNALSHMEQGKPVLAHYPQDSSGPFDYDREEVPSPAEVHEALKRIWERYPQTVELVYRENRR